MANVNLISGRRAERVRLNRIARGMAVTLVCVLALGVFSMGWMATRFILTQRAISLANVELERLRPVLDEIEAAERERVDLQPKLKTLLEAQTHTARWFGIMEGLKQATPGQTWLTNLAVEKAAEGAPLIRINGMTVSQTRVGETMWRLSQQPQFYAKVDLRYTQTTRQNDSDTIEFELAAKLAELGTAKAAGVTNAISSN